jgi:hypothetical protein
MYANVPPNSGIRTEIIAVTAGGIAVQSTARPENISRFLPVKASKETVVGTRHSIPISTALPKAKVMMVTLVGSGGTSVFARYR